MGLRLIDEIVSSLEAQRSQLAAAQARSSALWTEEEEFRDCWKSVYPDGRELTVEARDRIVRRLMRLGKLLRRRCGDFWIADRLLAEEDLYTDVAVRLLAHACAGNEAELRFCLDRSRPLFRVVAKRHEELLDEIEREMAIALPPTPDLSQAELARLLGVTYDTIRRDVRTGRWRPVPGDAVKHQRLRRWRHVDRERHADALKRIRRRIPRRIWSHLPSELQPRTLWQEPEPEQETADQV